MKNKRMAVSGVAILATLALAVGCGPQAGTGQAKAKTGKDGVHDHGAGPHGGTVADWGGGKYHVEFTVDHGKQEATVYVLGRNEKSPAPIKAKDDQLLLTIKEPAIQVTLKAVPQEGDTEGKASR